MINNKHVDPLEHGLQGTVSEFLSRKGYGFILCDNGMKHFVHYSDIKGRDFRTLNPGERVEYDLILGPKGLQAINVVRLEAHQQEEIPPVKPPTRTW